MAIEEPDHKVLQSTEHHDVRRYAPQLAIELNVAGSRNEPMAEIGWPVSVLRED